MLLNDVRYRPCVTSVVRLLRYKPALPRSVRKARRVDLQSEVGITRPPQGHRSHGYRIVIVAAAIRSVRSVCYDMRTVQRHDIADAVASGGRHLTACPSRRRLIALSVSVAALTSADSALAARRESHDEIAMQTEHLARARLLCPFRPLIAQSSRSGKPSVHGSIR